MIVSESITYNLAVKALMAHSKYMAVSAVGLGGGLCLNDVDFAEYNSRLRTNFLREPKVDNTNLENIE